MCSTTSASAPGPKGHGAERWGMVIVYLLLAYDYLGRCQKLVWVGHLALKLLSQTHEDKDGTRSKQISTHLTGTRGFVLIR